MTHCKYVRLLTCIASNSTSDQPMFSQSNRLHLCHPLIATYTTIDPDDADDCHRSRYPEFSDDDLGDADDMSTTRVDARILDDCYLPHHCCFDVRHCTDHRHRSRCSNVAEEQEAHLRSRPGRFAECGGHVLGFTDNQTSAGS